MVCQELFDEIRDSTTTVEWSKGVSMSRTAHIQLKNESEREVAAQLTISGRSVSYTVHLYGRELDWTCDCPSSEDPCVHVIATLVAYKNNKLKKSSQGYRLVYQLRKVSGIIRVERRLEEPCAKATEKKPIHIERSLLDTVQRLRGSQQAFVPSKLDYQIDQILTDMRSSDIRTHETARLLYPLLAQCSDVFLDEQRVNFREIQPAEWLVSKADHDGLSIHCKNIQEAEMVWPSGLILKDEDLILIDLTAFISCPDFKVWYEPIQSLDPARFFFDIWPEWKKKGVNAEFCGIQVPETVVTSPYTVIDANELEDGQVSLTSRLYYGKPPLCEVSGGQLRFMNTLPKQVPTRDKEVERKLAIELRHEVQLPLGQTKKVSREHFAEVKRQFPELLVVGQAAARTDVILPLKLTASSDEGNSEWTVQFVTGKGREEAALDEPAAQPFSLKLAEVYEAWRQGKTLVSLGQNLWGEIPHDWMSRYASIIENFLNQRKETLPSYMAPQIQMMMVDLASQRPHTLERLAHLHKDLKNDQEDHGSPPPLRNIQWRSYQAYGYRWLRKLSKHHIGALLADDMGLGKTLQAISIIRAQTLIVAPTSVISNWREQLEQLRPHLKVNVYHGAQRQWVETADVVITSYHLVRLEAQFLNQDWQLLILDEAHQIKNPQSQTYQAICGLRALSKLALTGTPVENHARDLWSLFNFLNPGLLGSLAQFEEQYARPMENGNKEAISRLRKITQPFILRRRKQEVLKELPPKTEVDNKLPLTKSQKEFYEALKLSTRQKILQELDLQTDQIKIFELILRLRQACCHTQLVPGGPASDSSKNLFLLEKLSELLEEGHKSLVFSQWTKYLDLIETDLKKQGIRFVRLDGQTKNRGEVLERFQNDPEISVFLLSLKAGGVGLNLTAADHVFLMDPWWNPAVEQQAFDRIHRFGQNKPVFMHRILTEGTIEEKVAQLQQQKSQLSEALLQTGKSSKLTAQALDFLLN